MNLDELSPADLQRLRPMLGEAGQARVDELLGAATPQVTAPKPRTMTRPEREMVAVLEMRQRQGEVSAWWYECVKVRIGVERCWYTPDFMVMLADGGFEFVETKGGRGALDDARVKFQAAAREHTWARWRMEKFDKGRWSTIADYPARATENIANRTRDL